MPYTPKPLKPYIPVPTKPYLPVATRPYIATSVRPFMPKPDRKKVGAELYENEVEALKAIGEAGGAATVRKVGRLLGRPPTRTHYDCEVLAEADYIDLFDSGVCRMKPLGWEELEERGHHFTGASLHGYIDVSYVELQLLMAIAEAGGATTILALRDHLNIENNELLALCQGLGQVGYVDLFQSGLCIITRAGRQQLGKAGYRRSHAPHQVTNEELQVLKAVGDAGGQASIKALVSSVGMERHEVARRCRELGGKEFIDFFNSGQCVMKAAGWQELEKVGHQRPEVSPAGLTEEELKILQVIGLEGGDTHVSSVAGGLGIDRRRATVLCEPLGERGYIDLFRSGRCVLTPRGREALQRASAGPKSPSATAAF